MNHETLRLGLIETAVAMNRCGLNQGTSGNLSSRCEGGMLITPSGMDYSGLEPGDIVLVDASGRPQGHRQPSSEWRIHQDIYAARTDALAILHAHPTACTALACLNRPIPAFHYMVAVAGGRHIPCAPYATFGSQELSDGVVAALVGRKACLMANHGLVCLAENLEKALALAIEIETLARTYLQALSVGEPVILDDAEMDRVLLKFRTYGVQDA
ncbi:L-fuculose-phosphate aldolase [Pseudomonadota bacterium]